MFVDDRHRRREREERAIVFVRLDDVQAIAAGEEIPFPRAHAPADERGRLATGRGESRRRHHGRRRLAVRAGDADELAPGGHFAECLGAANHGNAELARSHQLRMVLRHRRRDDERARAVDVRGIVRLDDDAEALRDRPPNRDSRRSP